MLTLQEPVEQTAGLSLLETEETFPVQGKAARNRAQRVHMAMAKGSPGEDVVENTIATGQEDILREQAAVFAQETERQRLMDNITRMAQTGQINAGVAVKAVQEYQQAGALRPMNHDTVLEEEFAKQYTKQFTNSNPALDSLFAQAQTYDPKAVEETVHGH